MVVLALTDDRGGGEAVAARRHVRGAQPDQGQAHRVRRRVGGDQLQRGGVGHGGRDQGRRAGVSLCLVCVFFCTLIKGVEAPLPIFSTQIVPDEATKYVTTLSL